MVFMSAISMRKLGYQWGTRHAVLLHSYFRTSCDQSLLSEKTSRSTIMGASTIADLL